MSKSYVIRAAYFGYNDEVFYVSGQTINSIHTDAEEALTKLNKLVVTHARQADLGEVDSVFDASNDYIKKLDDFVFEKCGKHIASGGYVDGGTYLPSELSDEDIFEFSKLAKMKAYDLVEFEDKPLFKTIWDCEKKEYQMFYDECMSGVIFAGTDKELKINLKEFAEENSWSKIKGNVDDITDKPALLNSLIESNKKLTFDSEKGKLKIKNYSPSALLAVNELLKKPLFEVRELTADQIEELESYD